MAKVTTKIEIDSHEICLDCIKAYGGFIGKEDSHEWYIKLTDFETWIDLNDLREWVINCFSPDEYDGHKQVSGKATFEEYFSDTTALYLDLSKFIEENKIQSRIAA